MHQTHVVPLLVSIVTYNHRRFIGRCLDSLARSGIDTPLSVVVVDNCSSDGSAELVRDHYPWVTLIVRGNNGSFAENNNIAFARYPSRYFLLLNPDTQLDKDSLNVLVDFMDRHPTCGICGPRLVFPGGTLQYSCRRFPTAWSTICRRTPARLLMRQDLRSARHLMVGTPHTVEMEVDWMLGACLLVRSDVILGSTILDEQFPLYCEDIDLCRRVSAAGWTIWYVPKTTVVHHHQAKSDAKLLCRETLLHTLSMLHFVKKHYLRIHSAGESVVRIA